MSVIALKRAYDPPSRSDGRRILVERLWPRGVKKAELKANAWLKEVAPSTALRQWFAHRVDRWGEFRRRYCAELDAKPDQWAPILEASEKGRVTLIYGAADHAHNGALVLRDYLDHQSLSRRPLPKATRGQGRSRSRVQ